MPNKHKLTTKDFLRPFMYASLFLRETAHEMNDPLDISFDRRSARPGINM